MDNKKSLPLSHAVRRKSLGSSQLRSPLAKRSPLAPVAQKGWLQKQGSEGLMLWKKRWCVLAEHCLFYYKTPEEEKLLGSILLPSYKVSPCSSDDRIYKKFAFKVEHANMRTYVFAAETREAMVQWMNALSLSTILQDNRDESGFTVTQQPGRKDGNINVNGWVPHQPLYANAPPKPRRAGNENSPSPSPDVHPVNQHYHPYPYHRPNGYVRPNPPVPNYQHPNQYYQGYHQLSSAQTNHVPVRRTYQPPRPHSADFLDYDANKYYEYQETTVVKKMDVRTDAPIAQRPRPKSSLDIVANDDRYYWSEERYAEKMRQSSMYLQHQQHQQQRLDDHSESFRRSASARIFRQAPDDEESDEVNTYMGGEESMKRLLEWKQRMLASPLTRKPSGSSGRGSAQNELSKYYKHQVLRELERQEARSREELGRKRPKTDGLRTRSRSTDGRRSAMSSSNRYNSYSSDDEGKNDEQRRERTRRLSQSGKQRRPSDDSKSKKPHTSPDYENLAQLPVERNGRMSAPPVRSYKRQIEESSRVDSLPIKSPEFPDVSPISDKVINVESPRGYQASSLNSTPTNLKAIWNEKLDESKLIKEFSYQYINEKVTPEKTDPNCKLLETPPENIVKSRIKQLGLEDDEKIVESGLKEPLKISPPGYLLNEAFVSHLKTPDPDIDVQDRRNSKNLRKFALGVQKLEELPPNPDEPVEKSEKTVKDLLADFEKKSQLAHERLEHEKSFEDSAGKRCVFSDTETLLYDTSSDTDERKTEINPAILSSLRRPGSQAVGSEDFTEEEGDEEVAAALGRRDRFFSSCREMNRNREQEALYKGKKYAKPLDERRLSVTDSMVVNEDSESACSTPTIEMIKDSLEKNLPKENVKRANEEADENHYMPMTPSRRISAPPSDKSRSNSSLHSVLYGVDIEETYVEMTEQEPNKSFLAKNRRPLMNIDAVANFPEQTTESHYDFLYRTSSQREPEYMEVNNILTALKQECSKQKEEAPPTPPRAVLPDILNSSATHAPKSDSSDADDESSKDLDSLDTPSHPRFSLSDTFRPASYYLGNNMMGTVVERHTSDHHDSSDSDLVSPPPIPTSPPPLEDLDTSLETENSLDMSTSFTSTPRKLKISDQDSCKRLWSKPRPSQDIKRRPVSENMIESFEERDHNDKKSKLDSVGNRSGVALDDENGEINLDMYLEDLQLGDKVNPLLYSKDFRSYEMQRNLTESFNKNDVSDKSLLMLRYPADDEPRQLRNDEVEYENLQAMFPPPPPELYESSDQSDRENGGALYRNLPVHTVPPPANYCDVYEPDRADPPKVRFDPVTLQQKDGLDASAPYYYSDIMVKTEGENSIQADRERNQPSTSRQRYQPLNNQREDVHEAQQGQKRNDIGRKVNPIQQLGVTEVEEVSDAQKFADELRTTSADFIDKSDCVDVRNIYESDTLQRRRAAIPVGLLRVRTPDLQHPQGIARNLYPHGLRDKSEEGAEAPLQFQASSSRSRSVEGLLEEAVERPRQAAPCEADDLWDEDSLWRESLRRVSRSLDNLDDGRGETPLVEPSPSGRHSALHFTPRPPIFPPSGRRSVDTCGTSRNKLPREVTYVNDGARRALVAEYEHDYREGRRLHKKPEEPPRRVLELPDSGIQDCDDGVHYERLKRDSESLERCRRGEVYLDRYDWDADREVFRNPKDQQAAFLEEPPHPHIEPIDRERLRQWDLMSSGTTSVSDPRHRHLMLSGAQDLSSCNSEPRHQSLDRSSSGQSGPVKILPCVHPGKEDHMDDNTGGDGSPQQQPLPPPPSQTAPVAQVSHHPDASASGSVMREAHLPRPPSATAGVGAAGAEDPKPPRPVPAILLTQETPQGHRPEDYEMRIDYYDRGKSPYRTSLTPVKNGYSQPQHWQDYSPYPDGRESYSDHRRPLSEYNVDPRYHQTRQPMSGGGTLPLIKTHHVQSSGTGGGRSVGTLPLSKSSGGRGGYGYAHEPRGPPKEYHNQGKREGLGGGRNSGGGSPPLGLDVSAGDLLGRTHEELVLLLIQLRRQSAGVCKAMEACHIEIEAQARLAELETPKRLEHLQKLEELKRHLLELEKQYEKGKPLVNLVDNMVKLGSLYRGNNSPSTSSFGNESGGHVREKLEFNQKVQEQRMLAEERREWDRLSPDQNQLQAKVQQLYKLDRLLQEESGTLASLQQDKELLEKALGGLRHKLQVSKGNSLEADRWRQQQKLLQKELSRVRLLLAHNSKKLEETVTENARLEQELVILRQKLQGNRLEGMARSSSSLLDTSTTNTTIALEQELRRVQTLVGDLQRQRQELSVQVRQLTEKSDTLVQQIRPGPTGVAGAGPIPGKKRPSGTWYETDLDHWETQDMAVATPTSSPQHLPSPPKPPEEIRTTTPIYINTDLSRKDVASPTDSDGMALTPVELSEADERMKRYYGIIPREKQEIKTVRIVKRESERRQKERDRSGNIGLPLGTNAAAKRVTVVDEVDEEEAPESPSTQMQDPYAHFHPTNPFLPQNLSDPLRTMSLPRGFGGKAPPPPIRQDHSNSLRSALVKRNRVRFEAQPSAEWSGSESGGSPCVESPNRTNSSTYGKQYNDGTTRPMSAREQLFGVEQPTVSGSPQLSPVYQSEAAREIVEEMARSNRRAVPKEKRRHHTVSNIRMFVDPDRVVGSRARDDMDMERALRPRINAPDVVRSTLSQKDLKYNETTIDTILGTPNKIVIPERYIPESEPILSAEEQLHRLRKAESIRKMLSESTALSTPDLSTEAPVEEEKTCTLKKKVEEEKRERERLLQLNQILAQQVMEKSKLVAVKALARLPLEPYDGRADDDDLSPIQPLPLYQQRDNFYS